MIQVICFVTNLSINSCKCMIIQDDCTVLIDKLDLSLLPASSMLACAFLCELIFVHVDIEDDHQMNQVSLGKRKAMHL